MLSVLALLWILGSSLKETRAIFAAPWGPPTLPLHFENFSVAWLTTDLVTAARNTTFVVSVATFFIVAIAAPASYSLSRADFAGAEALTRFFAIGIGIPIQAILVPLFLLANRLHMLDKLLGLIVVYVGVSLPFTVFLLTGFFRSIPTELEEAAYIDGATVFNTFLRVILPLARSGLITAAILNAVGLWNEFLLALSMINSNANFTLPLGIVNMYDGLRYTSNWAALFAGVVIVVLPITIVYLFLTDQIIEGLTLGAGK